MVDIVEDGENFEVNLGPTDFDDRTKRRLSFPFRLTRSVTTSPEAPAAPVTVSPETREEQDSKMFFKRRGEKLQSHLFEEEESELLQSENDSDEQSLVEAETAESFLTSALRMAEEGIGDNFLSISKAPRNDAIELGRRVSTFSNIRGPNVIDRSPSLLSDDGSVHTWDSQATETTFIKVPQVDPATITQETWGEIMGASSPDSDMEDDPLDEDEDDDPPLPAKSPPRTIREVDPVLAQVKPVVGQEAPSPANDRKWDKLRSTLEAQEKGTSVGYEAQLDPNRKKKSGSPQRIKNLGKGLRKSLVCMQRTSKAKAEGEESKPDDVSPAPEAPPSKAPSKKKKSAPRSRSRPQKDDKLFDVNIQVQDLSDKLSDQDLTPNTSFDPTEGSQEDVLQDPEEDESMEAESMEVVYLVSETDERTGETMPPFPTKLVGKLI
jgi:hypothetical protein